MDKFLDLLKESVIVQGIITVMFGSVISYLYVHGQPIPSELQALFGIIIGFYFGAKSQLWVNTYIPKIQAKSKGEK